MNENESETAKSNQNPAGKQPQPRVPRSIRFSDSEWACIEKEARAGGMTAAELVRHAAVSLAAGTLSQNSSQHPPEIVAQIERIYRGVYLISTLKRDEMIREGRQDECDQITKNARDSQVSIRHEASAQSGLPVDSTA